MVCDSIAMTNIVVFLAPRAFLDLRFLDASFATASPKGVDLRFLDALLAIATAAPAGVTTVPGVTAAPEKEKVVPPEQVTEV
jgi:hypothetical protein